ncbi:unnamed protein product [Triticum turgidum subsp. durum]|uniref:RING-type E3 ubiquitin transferase n=1 Tax=Triticum turgidum subsp. durum TaxID=4567 RepID=A0A9R1Q7Z9_TRITD|nr:unnamed protein product [Triticum turgidum subsp. durum]
MGDRLRVEGGSGPSDRKRSRREGSSSGAGAGAEQVVSVGSIQLDALDCNICYDPLRPPVFQCAIGHAICAACHGMLLNKDKCYVCSITGGYNRCIVVEQILESVQAACSNTKYGCTVKTHYHELKDHEKLCPHAPCFCPEAGCDFAGSTMELLCHLIDDHDWPSTEFEYGRRFKLQIQEGMHVLHTQEVGPLFLVKFTPLPPFGNATSILCIDPHAVAAERKFKCQAGFHSDAMPWKQYSDFHIRSTNLSNGLPTEDGSCSFVVPNAPSDQPTAACFSVSIDKISRGSMCLTGSM